MIRRLATSFALFALSQLAACSHPARPTATTHDATRPTSPPKPAKPGAELPAGVHVLLYKVEVVLDEAGRETRTFRRRYRIDDASAADQGWAATGSGWSPWRDEKPALRATVEAPDGTSRQLDPRTIEDASDPSDDPAVYSDRRVLRAPLPAIEKGSTVDETVVTRTKQPSSPRAIGRYEVLGDGTGADRLEISVDVPDDLPLRWKLAGDAGPVGEEHVSGRHRVTLVRKDFRREQHRDSWLPDDVAAVPYLTYATGASWREIAAHYATLVDGALNAARLGEKARAALAPGDDTPAKVRKLTELVQREVRYVGLEFGASAIVPHAPAETLQRRYGDCKDQATLLVGLLREVGIEADVALLDAGGVDADPELPSLDAFDHAIAYIPGQKPLWVDPTDASVRPGVLPMLDEGRLALVASSKTRELVRTPESAAADNVYRERREVWLPEEGRARLVETDEASGLAERDLRGQFSTPAGAKRDRAEAYVKKTYAADKLGAFVAGDAADRAKPFTLTYEALGTRRGVSNDEMAELIVEDEGAFGFIPESVLKDDRAIGAKLGYPHRVEIEVLAHATDDFEAASPPPGEDVRLGPAHLTRSFERVDAQTLRGRIVFELPRRALSSDELRALREGIAAHKKKDWARFRFPSRTATLEAEGRSPEALQTLRTRAQAPGASFVAGRRYVHELLRLGFVGEARRVAARLSAAWPSEEGALALDASLRLHDDLGRTIGGDVSYPEGIAFLKKALEKNPKLPLMNAMLAEAEMVDAAGRITMKRENLERARVAFEAWERDADAETLKVDANVPLTMLRLNDIAATRAATERRGADFKQRMALVLAAIDGGAEAVKRALDDLGVKPKDRASELETAAGIAVRTKHYEAALVLRQLEGEVGAPNEPQVRLARALRDGAATDPPDVAAARAFLVDLMFLTAEGRRVDGRTTATDLERQLVRQLAGTMAWLAELLKVTPVEVATEVAGQLISGQRGRTFGDLSEVQLTAVTGGALGKVLVATEAGHPRVVAADAATPPIIGALVAQELEHGHEARARALLDWYFGQHEADNSVPTSTPGLVVWRQTGDLRLAIAILRAGDSTASTSALANAPIDSTDRELRVALETARLFVGVAAGSNDTADTLARLKKDGASAVGLRPYEVRWRARRNEMSEVDRLLGDANIPASARAAGYAQAAYVRARLGKLSEAYDLFLKADGIAPLSNDDANDAAWFGFVSGRGADRRVLELARHAATSGATSELNTLATIEAGYQDIPTALATLAKWKTAVGRKAMRPSDALPYALLAERHGLVEEAIRLLEPIARETSPTGAGAFARQRIEALRKTARRE